MPNVDINAILDDSKTYKPEVLRALKEFKRAKTFRTTISLGERLTAMQELINKLTTIYAMPPITVTFQENPAFPNGILELLGGGDIASGMSQALPETREIRMRGRLSLITLLHEFAHLRFGSEELKAQRWAVNLFRKVYPKQFARLQFNGWGFVQVPTPPATPAPENMVV